jgi:hypothetical protein
LTCLELDGVSVFKIIHQANSAGLYLPYFSLLPQRKVTKERGHANMLSITLAGATPHLRDANARLSF